VCIALIVVLIVLVCRRNAVDGESAAHRYNAAGGRDLVVAEQASAVSCEWAGCDMSQPIRA
jgi:hypothetical protein